MNLRRDNIEVLVPDALLHRYVDVLLSRQQCRAIDAAVADDRELARTVEDWRAQNLGLHRLAAAQMPPPMPREMRESVRQIGGRIHRPRIIRAAPVAISLTLMAACAFVWLVELDVNVDSKQKNPITLSNQ